MTTPERAIAAPRRRRWPHGLVVGLVALAACLADPDVPASLVADAAPAADAPPAAPDAAAPPLVATRYPAGSRHAPYSAAVIARLRAVRAASSGDPTVFAKVGDSISVDPGFLHCFAGPEVRLEAWSAAAPTVGYFAATQVDDAHSSFTRDSEATHVGWGTVAALAGDPSAIQREVAALDPAFAVVMLGTNETGAFGILGYEANLTRVVDALLDAGVIPLLSTIPPRGDSAATNRFVPEMNAVVRVVAQKRQVPLMDYWQTLIDLPGFGLEPDGVHPRPYDYRYQCWFTDEALRAGMNQRNLIALEALDRARRFVIEDEAEAAEPAPAALAGDGSLAAPWVVDGLPFVDVGDTGGRASELADYACAGGALAGPEGVYRVEVAEATQLRARLFRDPGVGATLRWLTAPDGAACTRASLADNATQLVEGWVEPGTYYLVVDTPLVDGVAPTGGYRLTVVPI